MSEVTQILIIGGGVAGYPAAIRASRMGAEVTLIEKDAIGGTCLNWGCIPTKALLQSAGVVQTMKSSELFGIRCHGYDVDFGAVMSRKNAVVSRLTRGVGALLKARKINVVQGTASFVDAKTVRISETGEQIRADAILIATGSKPGRIAVEGINGPDVMDSNQVLSMTSLPASVDRDRGRRHRCGVRPIPGRHGNPCHHPGADARPRARRGPGTGIASREAHDHVGNRGDHRRRGEGHRPHGHRKCRHLHGG